MSFNYPPKPWINGQTIIEKGVTYVYDAATNTWNFSPQTFEVAASAINVEVPSEPSTFEIEFSEDKNFNTLSLRYVTNVIGGSDRILYFDGSVFKQIMTNGIIDNNVASKLIVMPELSMIKQYYVRYRWKNASDGTYSSYSGFVYPQ